MQNELKQIDWNQQLSKKSNKKNSDAFETAAQKKQSIYSFQLFLAVESG